MSLAPPLAERTRRRVALPFAICTLVWGSTWFVIGSQLHYAPAAWSITYRFAGASIAMFVVAAAMRLPLRLDARGHVLAGIIGVTQFMLNYVFVYAAEERIASGLVALVSALLIVPNAVFGRIFLGQAASRRFLIGSAVAMAGIAMLFADELERSGVPARRVIEGVALALGGVFAASAANVLQATRAAAARPPPTLLAWGMAYGAAIDLALAAALDGPPPLPTAPIYWAGLAYLVLAGSALTFSLYFGLIRAIGPARAGYIGVIVPVIAMALSTLFEGYRWSGGAAAGAALAIAGLLVAMRARNPAR